MIKKNQAIDVSVAAGASFTRVGIFKNKKIVKSFKFESRPGLSPKRILEIFNDNFNFQAGILKGRRIVLTLCTASAASAGIYSRACKTAKIDFLNIDSSLKLPLKINYDPAALPAFDRICAAVAAHEKFRAESGHIMVIDFGRSTKFGIISDGAFMGGLVLPGFSAYANALGQKSDHIFRVHYNRLPGFLCRDRNTELLAGIYGGYSVLINGIYKKLIEDARFDEKNTCVVTTGGYANFFTTNVDFPVINDQALVLEGINIIGRLNRDINE